MRLQVQSMVGSLHWDVCRPDYVIWGNSGGWAVPRQILATSAALGASGASGNFGVHF